MRYNESAPGGAGNTTRTLTRSTSISAKEGLDMDSSHQCILMPATQSISTYQIDARMAFEDESGQKLNPWAWVLTTCEQRCVNAQHLYVVQPTKIAYAPGQCVYCGVPSGTQDHLTPRTISGETRRHWVATVPACGECNSLIGTAHMLGVHERRAIAHERLAKKKRATLATPDRSPREMREFGPTMRKFIESKAAEKQLILARLNWPEDPLYDLRAFQKSGIEDPVLMGLCADPFEPTPSLQVGSGWPVTGPQNGAQRRPG